VSTTTGDSPSHTAAPAGAGAANAATGLTIVVAVGILVQAVLAGVFASGNHPHTVEVHKVIGPALILPSFVASLITRRRLRTTPTGRRAYVAGIGVTTFLIIETALGLLSDDHPGLLVLHIPIAIGLFGMLVRQLTSLRQLTRPT
jgi:hypothetical protein